MEVFISHSSVQKPWVEALGHNLKSCGYTVFVDKWDLVPGRSYIPQLDAAIDRCDAAIIVVTPAAMQSGWVREEYEKLRSRKAEASDFPLIPVILEGVEAKLPFIGNIHYVDFRAGIEYHEAFQRLISGLDGNPPGPKPRYSGNLILPPDDAVELPQTTEESSSQAVQQDVARQVSDALHNGPFVVVLVPQKDGIGEIARELSEFVGGEFDPDSVHLTHLPLGNNEEKFWAELARQLEDTPGAEDFEEKIMSRLAADLPFTLIANGIEHAGDECRELFCKKMRFISDAQSRFRVVFLGSHELYEIRFANGAHSVIAGAASIYWPVTDVARQLDGDQHWGNLTDAQRALISDAAAGDLRLARTLMAAEDVPTSLDDVVNIISSSDWLYSSLLGLARDADARAKIAAILENDPIRSWVPYFPHALHRRLFWAGLAKSKDNNMVWRSEAVRRAIGECLKEWA